jgi:hypothetical protein
MSKGSKRSREDDGFGSPAADMFSDAAAQSMELLAETMSKIHDVLAPCKTLKQFKAARDAIIRLSDVTDNKALVITINMLTEKQRITKK